MAFPNPTDAFSVADMAPFIAEIWTPIVHETKYAPMSILNFATDLSEFISEGGDVIHVPNIYTNTFTVQTQTTEGNGVIDESPAPGDTTITVSTHKYIAFVIGDKTVKLMMRSDAVVQKYATQARNLLMKAVEDSLFALYSSLTRTDIGLGTAAVTDLVIRQAIAELTDTDGAVYEKSDLGFFFHTTVYWAQILGIAKYYDKSVSGLRAIETGALNGNFGPEAVSGTLVGGLYGIPVYATPRVVTAATVVYNMLIHRDAFGFGFHTQGPNGVRVQSAYLLQNLATLTVADIIYGVGVLRADAGVVILADAEETVA